MISTRSAIAIVSWEWLEAVKGAVALTTGHASFGVSAFACAKDWFCCGVGASDTTGCVGAGCVDLAGSGSGSFLAATFLVSGAWAGCTIHNGAHGH